MTWWRDLTAAEAEVEFGQMVVDATSIVGGEALLRDFPAHWRELITRWLPHGSTLHVHETLGEVLTSGAYSPLLPRAGTPLHSLKRVRGCARRLYEVAGHVPVCEFSEERVQAIEDRLKAHRRSKTGRPIGRRLLRRDINLLRSVVRWFADRAGIDQVDPVRPRGPRRKGGGGRQPVPRPWEARAAFDGMTTQLGRLAVVLAVGCGVINAERRRLRVDDIAEFGGVYKVWVPTSASRRSGRWTWVPSWGASVIRAMLQERRAPEAHLFPGDSDHALRRELRGVTSTRFERLSFQLLRRTYQAVGIANELARGLVRGSWEQDRADRSLGGPAVYPRAYALARGWLEVGSPPNKAKMKAYVTSRAPRGVALDEPEPSGMQFKAERSPRVTDGAKPRRSRPIDQVRVPRKNPRQPPAKRPPAPKRAGGAASAASAAPPMPTGLVYPIPRGPPSKTGTPEDESDGRPLSALELLNAMLRRRR